VGTVTGTYGFSHAPWPSTWVVYLLINNQITMGGNIVYEFNIAADPETYSDPYDACFSVTDFVTTGQVTTTPPSSTYYVNPNISSYFNFTQYT
jgi:hypothetical protein